MHFLHRKKKKRKNQVSQAKTKTVKAGGYFWGVILQLQFIFYCFFKK